LNNFLNNTQKSGKILYLFKVNLEHLKPVFPKTLLDKGFVFLIISLNISIKENSCPAEESANCGKLLLINARKNCEKTDIKINNWSLFL